MKRIFFTIVNIICIYLFSIGQNQENLKIGGYRYAYELKLNSPSIEYKFIIEERTKSEIVLSGGNNYKISTQNNDMSVVDINKNVWGVYDGKSFYINTINYTGNLYFAKGEVIGKYVYFIGAPPFNEKLKKELGYDKDSFVPIFGIIGGVAGAVIASSIETSQNLSNPVSFLLDIQTDKAICISKDLLYQKIAQYPELKAEYFADTIYDSGEKVRKYIKKLSDKHPEITLTAKDIKEKKENILNNQLTELKQNLVKMDTNMSYQNYYQSIIEFTTHPEVEAIKLVSEKYSNGAIKSIGLEAKHYIQIEEDYSNQNKFFRIGTWRYFYNNGQIKMLVDYDLRERKDGRLIKFNKDGKIKKEEVYKLDWKIK